MRNMLFLAVATLPAVALAQTARVELVPTVGYAWGGKILIEERAFRHRDFDVGISASGVYGLRVNAPITRNMAGELLVERQDTQLKDNQGLFGEVPGGFVVPGSTHILDLELSTFHGGLVWFLRQGPTRWHLVASVGLTHINALLPLPSDTALSYSVGTGVQLELSDHLAVRFEGRYLAVDTDQHLRATYRFANPDCTAPCSYTFAYKDWASRTSLTTGLAIRF